MTRGCEPRTRVVLGTRAFGHHVLPAATRFAVVAFAAFLTALLVPSSASAALAPGPSSSRPWTKVSSGGTFALALKADGSLWAWGSGNYGQLGNGSTYFNLNVPTRVGTDTAWVDISAGQLHSLGVKSDGTLWGWGNSLNGQVPGGDYTPNRIGYDNDWVAVSGGSTHSLALKENGMLWAWGDNSLGQCGIGQVSAAAPSLVGTSTDWVAISAGGAASYGLKADGSAWSWGYGGTVGALGNGLSTSPTPAQIGTETTWAAIEAGDSLGFGRRNDGSLFGWGFNQYGEVGNGTNTNALSPAQVATGTAWSTVSAGNIFGLGIKADGTLWAWGNNQYGQLGDGTTNDTNTPIPIAPGTHWSDVDGGYTFTTAIAEDGTLWSWGWNNYGQLGDRTWTDHYTPVEIGSDTDAPVSTLSLDPGMVSSGTVTFSVTATDNVGGTITSYYSIDGSYPDPYGAPVIVSAEGNHRIDYYSVDAAGNVERSRGVTVTVDGTAPAITSLTSTTHTDTATTYSNYQPILRMSVVDSNWASEYACAVDHAPATVPAASVTGTGATIWLPELADGTWYAHVRVRDSAGNWSSTSHREIRIDSTPPSGTVVLDGGATFTRSLSVTATLDAAGASEMRAAASSPWTSVAGSQHTLAVKGDGSLWAWGYNYYGQLGLGSTQSTAAPVRVGADSDWSRVSATSGFSSALKRDGSLWTWGLNTYWQLGDGTTDERWTPAKIAGGTRVTSVSTGINHGIALDDEGAIWVWGYGSHGELGDNTWPFQMTPTQLVTSTVFAAADAGANSSYGMTSDGSLFAWGQNTSGQLGIGTSLTETWAPTPVAGGLHWRSVAAGDYHTLAIRDDGSLWAWGRNNYGQLGDGTTTQRNAPVRIGNDTDWVAIQGGTWHSLAEKADGSLWAWGRNFNNQLGDATAVDRFTPTRIGRGNDWRALAAGTSHSLAVDSHGTLWAWGRNNNGQVGRTNEATDRPRPVIEDAAWSGWSAPVGTMVVPLRAAEGTQSVLVEARDANGNYAVFVDEIVRDATAPGSSVASLPSEWTSGSVSVSLSASDALSGVNAIRWSVGAGTETYTAPFSVSEEGTTTLTWWAVDGAGNAENPHEASVRIDKTKPVAAPQLEQLSDGSAFVRIAPEDSLSGVASYATRLDAGAWSAQAFAFTDVSGDHVFEYVVRDAAGNETTGSLEFRAGDSQPPVTAISGVPAGWTNGDVTLSLSATDALSPIAGVYYRVGAGQAETYTAPVTISAAGSTTVAFWAVDEAGNAESEQSALVRIDRLAPVCAALPRTLYGTNETITVSASDTGGSGIESTWISVDGGTYARRQAVRIGVAGTHTLRYYCIDRAGSQSATRTVSVKVVKPVTLGAPVGTRTATRTYTLYGTLKPRHAAGSKPVRIYLWRRSGGSWVASGYVSATAYNYSTYTRYKVSKKFPSSGSWRMRAYHPLSSAGAATWSSYSYLTVR